MQNANNPPWWTSLRDPLDPGTLSLVHRARASCRCARRWCSRRWTTTPQVFARRRARAEVHDAACCVADRLLPDLLAAGQRVAAPSERAARRRSTRWPRGIASADAGSRGAVLFERFLAMYEAAA